MIMTNNVYDSLVKLKPQVRLFAILPGQLPFPVTATRDTAHLPGYFSGRVKTQYIVPTSTSIEQSSLGVDCAGVQKATWGMLEKTHKSTYEL